MTLRRGLLSRFITLNVLLFDAAHCLLVCYIYLRFTCMGPFSEIIPVSFVISKNWLLTF